MSGTLVTPPEQTVSPSAEQLGAVLSRALERRGSRGRIVDIERSPCPYGSSWWLEEITIHLDDSSQVALVFKNLDSETSGSAARQVKPAFVIDPTREPWVYENLLMDTPGPPRLWAAASDSAAGRNWLFLERVDGTPLAQLGDRNAWCAAAEWLGRFHATAPIGLAADGPVLRHTHQYHRRWLARALGASHDGRLRALASAHERAIDEAIATDASLIHGEFYASNVLIEQFGSSFTVRPVDWEMAALGPPLLDLAALMSGRWSADDRMAMTTAYREGARSANASLATLDDLLHKVTACRLLLAVQWLGWAAEWTAPAGHRNDWLEEAELCARELCR